MRPGRLFIAMLFVTAAVSVAAPAASAVLPDDFCIDPPEIALDRCGSVCDDPDLRCPHEGSICVSVRVEKVGHASPSVVVCVLVPWPDDVPKPDDLDVRVESPDLE